MKRYPTFSKNFNLTRRALLIFAVLYPILLLYALYVAYIVAGFTPLCIILIVLIIVLPIVFCCIHKTQLTLKNARIGKHLKKHYNLYDEMLEAAFESIEREINSPIYSDAPKNHLSDNFFITYNWLVGTDGMYCLRANACKRDNVKHFGKNTLKRCINMRMYYYFVLEVTEHDDYRHQFIFRTEKHRDIAYDYLTNNLKMPKDKAYLIITIDGVDHPIVNFKRINRFILLNKKEKAIKELQGDLNVDLETASNVVENWHQYVYNNAQKILLKI